jgi:hypothetical protein
MASQPPQALSPCLTSCSGRSVKGTGARPSRASHAAGEVPL